MSEYMAESRRLNFNALPGGVFWGDAIADVVTKSAQKESVLTCAAGISPSGVVHFGNFRDVITSYVVARALVRRGAQTRLIFSWDNFDRLRKVPAGVPESFAEHIGKPLTKVPDPTGERASYADHFQAPFVAAMQELGIELEYINQTEQYESGAYDEKILLALEKRREIADILLSMMTEKGIEKQGINRDEYREKHFPISVYSRFTGKDSTVVLAADGPMVTYRCLETNQEDTIDITKEHRVKLGWKVDWAMRWQHESVVFEPGGHDHASPGGSYDTSTLIAREIFGYEPPIFAEYKFVGIQGLGAKMSGSKGNAISPRDLLGIYEPALLKWLYLRKSPDQSFMLAFDSEVYRQYDEFDREVAAKGLDTSELADALGTLDKSSLENPIPFRQAVGFGQIVQWDADKLEGVLKASGHAYSRASIEARLPRAREWLDEYNSQDKFELLANPNTSYAQTLSDESRAHVEALRVALEEKKDASVEELEHLVYNIPKKEGLTEAEVKKAQRAFFGHVYNLLIGKDTGPRLSTFLWALDRNRVLSLLSQ